MPLSVRVIGLPVVRVVDSLKRYMRLPSILSRTVCIFPLVVVMLSSVVVIAPAKLCELTPLVV